MIYDVIIIGGGITGTSIAFELAKYNLKVALLEANNDIAMGTTKANSGIIHAGYDPKVNTLMAKLNVKGSKLYQELAPKLNVHYKQIGSLVIGRDDKDLALIKELYARGVSNGVEGLKILSQEEIKIQEPHLDDDIKYALFAPSAAIISPWEMALALMTNAINNGVELYLNNYVYDISQNGDNFVIHTSKNKYQTRYIINAAGLYADYIYDLVLEENIDDHFKIAPIKGEYFLLDKQEGDLVHHVIFQTPNELGKGVLVSPTVHGNLIVGPNADKNVSSKDDVSTKKQALDYIKQAADLTTHDINYRDNIRNFSGVRASIEQKDDFLIEESKYVPHFINFAGIKSPGLSSSLAFGDEVIEILKSHQEKLTKKKNFTITPLPKRIKEMTPSEVNEMVKKDPRYGIIICRCESVTEGEIVSYLHGPIRITSLDGIKRRTNAGMGRCQQGFCGPKVLEIIARENQMSVKEVLQDGNGSNIVLGLNKGDE